MKTFILNWFYELENPTLFFVIGAFLILFVVITATYLVLFIREQNKHYLAIQQRIHHYLVYRINLKLDVIYEFDPKHPGKEKILSISQFLKKFPAAEAEKIYQWWEKLLVAKLDTPWILTSKTAKRKAQQRQVIFEVIKIDETKQTVHLHQYGLKYLKPNTKKVDAKSLVISSQQALDLVKKLPGKQGLFVSFFMMFPRAGLDEQFKYFYLSQIKEKVIPYLTNQVLLVDTANDILLIITKALETHEYMQIAQGFFQIISQYVEVNALESLIKFNMALIEHKHFPNDFKSLMRKSKELNQIMLKKKLNILAYEAHQPVAETLKKNENLFAQDFYQAFKFQLLFRPLIEQTSLSLFGQQVIIQPTIPSTLTTLELLQEAPMMMTYTKDFYRRYFTLIEAASQASNVPLIVPFSLTMKLQTLLQEIKIFIRPQNIIVLLDETEVKELASTEVSLKTWAEPLKRQGMQFALSVDVNFGSLGETVYRFFDYFYLPYQRIVNVENNQKTTIQLKLIFQNLVPLNKPIIVSDLISEGSLEILPLKHAKMIGADWLVPYQSTIEQPSKRIYTKLKNLLDKQEQYYGKTN